MKRVNIEVKEKSTEKRHNKQQQYMNAAKHHSAIIKWNSYAASANKLDCIG